MSETQKNAEKSGASQSYRYEVAKQRITERSASLEPDARLPSRPAQMAELGVARTTVDRAISELIGEGLLNTREGSGTYVSTPAKLKAAAGARHRLVGVIVNRIVERLISGEKIDSTGRAVLMPGLVVRQSSNRDGKEFK